MIFIARSVHVAALSLILHAGAGAQGILRCDMNHPGGSREQSVMSLSGTGELAGFTWMLKTRKGASCDIRADSFRVVRSDLLEGRNGCQMMLWRQGAKFTLALSPSTPGCQSYCTSRAAYESLLPVSFDIRGAGCAM